MNAVGFRIRIIRTYDEIGGVARSVVSFGLAQIHDCGHPLRVYVLDYTGNL